MEDKKQDVNSLKELFKVVNAYSGWFANLADELSKVLADIKISKKEEDAWKMKCPYKEGDGFYFVNNDGSVGSGSWSDWVFKTDCFNQGNVFPTKQEAELESKRRNLLTRFKAFRDECNGNWKINWKDVEQAKYIIKSDNEGDLHIVTYWTVNEFHLFGYFKDYRDAQRAIELFGDEIIELFMNCEV